MQVIIKMAHSLVNQEIDLRGKSSHPLEKKLSRCNNPAFSESSFVKQISFPPFITRKSTNSKISLYCKNMTTVF